jgi:hypothetical protein
VYYFTYLVISKKDVEIRVNYLQKYTEIMRYLKKNNNFSSLHTLFNTFNNIKYYMPKTWNAFVEKLKRKNDNFMQEYLYF